MSNSPVSRNFITRYAARVRPSGMSHCPPSRFGNHSANRLRISATNFGNLRQRWSRSISGPQSHPRKIEVSMWTSGRPSLRSVVHLSRTVVTLTPLRPVWLFTALFATVLIAFKNSVLACLSSLGTSPLRYTHLHKSSTCWSVSGIVVLKLGADHVFAGAGAEDGSLLLAV